MTIYSIYKATNSINGKVYIGFTKNGLRRIHGHKNSKHSNDPFHNAIRKYGISNFIWEIIYQSRDQDHTLNVMEPHFIREYNSYVDFENSNGYNATLGGGEKYTHSAQTLSKLSRRGKKQWLDIEYRNKMVNYNKTKWSNPEFLKKRDKGWEITTPTGEIVTCLNLAEYCRSNNLDDGCMVSVSKGDRPQHKGYACKRISFVKTISYS